VEHFSVEFSDPSCVGFRDIARKKNKQTDKQTNGGKNATPATADGVRKQVVKEF